MTEPLETEFVAGDTFTYKPIISDRNIDATIDYRLENKPEGMYPLIAELLYGEQILHILMYMMLGL